MYGIWIRRKYSYNYEQESKIFAALAYALSATISLNFHRNIAI